MHVSSRIRHHSLATWLASCLLVCSGATGAAQVAIDGPAGSGEFGRVVAVLPNGNFVVTDPGYDAPGPIADVGAVYLFRPDGSVISTLRGSQVNDRVGNLGVTVLPSGNYLIHSQNWSNGAAIDAGAVTFALMETGVNGAVSAENSLVGGSERDYVGSDGVGERKVTVLANGNYVIRSYRWNVPGLFAFGAVTFGSGTSGVAGVVSATNSLVAGYEGDGIGSSVVELRNGNYLVCSHGWGGGTAPGAGAITLASGLHGATGVISPLNSLTGATQGDDVGRSVVALSNGDFIARSPSWSRSGIRAVGAVTYVSGLSGLAGRVSPENSLVGTRENDWVGSGSIVELNSGNVVVASPVWDRGTAVDAGAVTLLRRGAVTVGEVTPQNSLVGAGGGHRVGDNGAVALANGNYVVVSPFWSNGSAQRAGAVTFGFGSVGITGDVNPTNSLVGTSFMDADDSLSVVPLVNGNYVVVNPKWNNESSEDAGAVTFGSGVSGISGPISEQNSLVGASPGDSLGINGVVALASGNYVVCSSGWDNGSIVDAGAASFGSGVLGLRGVVTPANSLIGSTPNDFVAGGYICATPLSSGDYVVSSPSWSHGLIADVGAVTQGSGTFGVVGTISPSNSLVGLNTNDRVGWLGVFPTLGSANYFASSWEWDALGTADVGALTFVRGATGLIGSVGAGNSLIGAQPADRVGRAVFELSNGSSLVMSAWSNGTTANVSALTYVSNSNPTVAQVSASNSLVGSSTGDSLGYVDTTLIDDIDIFGIEPFDNGNFVVFSPRWNNAGIVDAGAVTLGLSDNSIVGPLTTENSVLGLVARKGEELVYDYDATRTQLIVGLAASNRIVLHRPGVATNTTITSDTPDPSNDSEPVTFVAVVNAAPSAVPANGKVRFLADSGESCEDTTPTVVSQGIAEFACALTFETPGKRVITAEYLGSFTHAFSNSLPEAHSTIENTVYRNGFE